MNHCRFPLMALWVLVTVTASIEMAYGQTAAATEKKETAPVDPTGTWKWEYSFNDNAIEGKLKLKWDNKKLVGKYTAFDNTTDIEEVKLEKDQLSFITKREFDGNEFVVKFNGKVKPDDIEGTVAIGFGGNGPQRI